MKIIRLIGVLSIPILLTAFTFQVTQDRTPSIAKNIIKSTSFFDQLAAYQSVPEINITTDVLHFIQNKRVGEHQPAFLSVNNQEPYEIKIRPRGRFRLCNCEFPPVKLNFSKKEFARQFLAPDFDKFKLVMPCARTHQAEEDLLKEYLIYKIYNQLTENSFRVVLVKMTFTDLHNSTKPYTTLAFLIEPTNEMASRLNGLLYEESALKPETIAKKEADLQALFQYMIGNEDWGTVPIRNLKVIKNKTTGKYILIPYDFDFSGLVNANYAIPSLKHQHSSVKERYYNREFSDLGHAKELQVLFHNKKPSITNLITEFEGLSGYERKQMLRYVETFYNWLKKEDKTGIAYGE